MRFEQGGGAIGTFIKLPSLELAELVAIAGFDFVVIDAEHAPLSVRDIYELVVVYSGLGVAPLVRVPDHGYGDAQRILDSGAAGVLVPHVSARDQAEQVARQLLFPPRGTRGMGVASRAGRWGTAPSDVAEYLRRGDEEISRIAMIEEPQAIDNIEQIIDVVGIDALFIGPGDLSLSMGLQVSDQRVTDAVDHAIARAVANAMPVGTVVGSAQQARRRADQGCAFVVVGSDAGIAGAALKSTSQSIRDALEGAT